MECNIIEWPLGDGKDHWIALSSWIDEDGFLCYPSKVSAYKKALKQEEDPRSDWDFTTDFEIIKCYGAYNS